MEDHTRLLDKRSLSEGLLSSLIVAASVGFLLAFFIETAIGPAVGSDTLTIFFAPLVEEAAKALGMLPVAYFMWKIVLNRRYGAALGAAAGLGFGVVESCYYIYQIVAAGAPGEITAVRIIVTPLMHPLWSAFVGIGVSALVAGGRPSRPERPKSPVWLPLLFLLFGMANHVVWNGILVALGDFAYVPIILNVLFVFPLFAIMLRDLLGGHFNFPNFLEPVAEPFAFPPPLPPPPPPPP